MIHKHYIKRVDLRLRKIKLECQNQSIQEKINSWRDYYYL